jgi:ABC-type uncharacterized transport system ATPase subunit
MALSLNALWQTGDSGRIKVAREIRRDPELLVAMQQVGIDLRPITFLASKWLPCLYLYGEL